MDNKTKISLIHEIVQPYFKFELDDIYGDRGGTPYPKIKDLTELYFKKKLIMKINQDYYLHYLKMMNK